MTYTVVVTDADYPDQRIEREVLAERDAELRVEQTETAAAVIDAARDADALLNQYAPITDDVLCELDDLQVVSRYGTGVDNIDVEAATAHGVAVTNVPVYCAAEVSTHALSLLLAVARNVTAYDTQVKSGTWDWKTGQPLGRISGSTLGFVAFGEIPQHLAAKVNGFDLDLLAYDPYRSPGEISDHGVEKVGFETLLTESDFVSVHSPLVDETHHLLDAEAFARMKDTAILINTARGPVVDEAALFDALAAGELRGAGLDVMASEPPEDSPLLDREDVVVTPHVGWYSEQSLETLRRKATENVVQALFGEQPDRLVNTALLDK